MPARTTLHRKAKHNPSSAVKAECERLWSAYVKRRGVCEFAGMFGECEGPLEAAHIVARSQSARVMYHPQNGVSCCQYHHRCLDNKVSHQLYVEMRNYLRIRRNRDVRELNYVGRVRGSIKVHEWEDILQTLKDLTK